MTGNFFFDFFVNFFSSIKNKCYSIQLHMADPPDYNLLNSLLAVCGQLIRNSLSLINNSYHTSYDNIYIKRHQQNPDKVTKMTKNLILWVKCSGIKKQSRQNLINKTIQKKRKEKKEEDMSSGAPEEWESSDIHSASNVKFSSHIWCTGQYKCQTIK